MVIVIDKKYMNTAHKILRENKYSYKIIGQTLRDSQKIKTNVCRLKICNFILRTWFKSRKLTS